MNDARCPISFADLADYWFGDTAGDSVDSVEQHLFTCTVCAERLGDLEALGRAVVKTVRAGRFRCAVSDAVLNRLAREGVRMRTYTLHPGDVVPCAVWGDDDVIVTRLRAELGGLDSVTVVTRLDSGEEIDRMTDVPVRSGQFEVIGALSASILRQLPSAALRVTMTGRIGDVERTIGDYRLEHAGTFD